MLCHFYFFLRINGFEYDCFFRYIFFVFHQNLNRNPAGVDGSGHRDNFQLIAHSFYVMAGAGGEKALKSSVF